ncbi:MAG: small ribosomal subunit Rsm22 family protein, partial [Treponema sp.]|nr:small ribosomal subunit Rsm22 family protein [Treponema sp.]
RKKEAALVCAVNLFNEIYEDLSHNNSEGLRRMAANIALLMHNQASPDARILTVEPGVPQSGQFIGFLRSAFLELDRPPLSPCPHSAACPMPGGKTAGAKNRWCHFAFSATDAPKELLRLSSAAGISKERLVLSYLLAGSQTQAQPSAKTAEKVRVISDAFALPNKKIGRYACCSDGLVLLTGDKIRIEKIASGELVSKNYFSIPVTDRRDAKSGALIMEVK